jgi:hypothetical protein
MAIFRDIIINLKLSYLKADHGGLILLNLLNTEILNSNATHGVAVYPFLPMLSYVLLCKHRLCDESILRPCNSTSCLKD